ncbi:hypothetical protein [Nevskia soli]|uniref:hypothetical protein n=1 Tax=Nevskia soli TaxID=418856 RepID=UPI0012F78E0E|nr:hypothetical protein [Nevskia soli]
MSLNKFAAVVMGAMMAVMALAGAPVWAGSDAGVELVDGATKVSIAVKGDAHQGGEALRVAVVSDGRSAEWSYDNVWLDPERTGKLGAEIAGTSRGKVLLVHAYSGGAACCWSLLAFDLGRLKPLGESVPSQGSIEILKGKHGCALGASSVPVATGGPGHGGERTFYCFDGERFVKSSGGGRKEALPGSDGADPGREKGGEGPGA